MSLLAEIRAHLVAQYQAWERILYPDGRTESPAALEVILDDGESGYRPSMDKIMLFVPEGNVEEFGRRFGQVRTAPDRQRLIMSEIELLHEMLHEMQFRSIKAPNPEGIALHAKYQGTPLGFSGPGHDEVFYTAIALAAVRLGVTADQLVADL